MFKSKFNLTIIFILIVSHLSISEIEKSDIDTSKISRKVAYTLPALHLNRLPLDEYISTNAFINFLDTLDPSHCYFLEEDINKLKDHFPELHYNIRKGDTSFATQAYEILTNRMNDRLIYTEKLIDNGFNTSIDEDFLWDRSDLLWPENKSEWDHIWRKKIKNEYIGRIVADSINEDYVELDMDGISTNLNDTSISDVDLEPKEFILDRYKQIVDTMSSLDNEMLLQRYLSSFSRIYDPHSDYLSPSNVEDFDINMKLSLVGIGAMLSLDDGTAKIVRLIPGGPAEKDGRLKPGDKIIAVAQGEEEAQNIMHWPLYKAVRLIRGKKDSKVILTIIPKTDKSGTQTKKIDLIRDEVKLEEQAAKSDLYDFKTSSEKNHRIGVIELPGFYVDFKATNARDRNARRSANDVRNLINELADEEIDGLILDLRNNGGGSLIEAIEIAGLFITSGPIVQVRDSRSTQILPDIDPIIEYDGPLIVLVNRLSASASEILAAAMQDYKRAIIIGDEHTHGKGTVQTLRPLGDRKGSLKITTSSYYRINGGSTQIKGVTPDIIIPSFYDVMETGEKELDYALPWDTIRPVYYKSSEGFDNILPTLIKSSEDRRSKNSEFQSFLKQRKRLKERYALKSVSLVLTNRLAEAEIETELDKILESQLSDEEENSSDNSEVSKVKDLDDADMTLNETLLIFSDWLELLDNNSISQID